MQDTPRTPTLGPEDVAKPRGGRRLPSDATPATTRSKSAEITNDIDHSHLDTVAEHPEGVDSPEPTESVDVVSCACVISFREEHVSSYKPVTVLENVLRDIHNQGSYVPVLAGSVLTSWFHDPGAEMAQISEHLLIREVPPFGGANGYYGVPRYSAQDHGLGVHGLHDGGHDTWDRLL